MAAGMLAGAGMLCAAGPLLLRWGWQRQRLAVAGGWALLALAALMLTKAQGAWGLTVGATVAMATALLILAFAAVQSPAPLRTAPARTIRQRAAEPQIRARFDGADLARRSGVFLIVVVVDLVASLWLAWVVQRALVRGGGDEANALAVALFGLPVAWLIVASWQMTMTRLGSMLMLALAMGVAGGIVWLAV